MNNVAYLEPVGDDSWKNVVDSITICGREYYLTFTREGCDGPCLKLTKVSNGVVYNMVRESCECNVAYFSTGDTRICTGTKKCGGPCENLVRIKVAWMNEGYDGEGWYCVRGCGTTGNGIAVELLDGDAIDPSIEILSGPYDTMEDVICVTPCCLGIGTQVCISRVSGTPLDDENLPVTLTRYIDGTDTWSLDDASRIGTFPLMGAIASVKPALSCTTGEGGAVWQLAMVATGFDGAESVVYGLAIAYPTEENCVAGVIDVTFTFGSDQGRFADEVWRIVSGVCV